MCSWPGCALGMSGHETEKPHAGLVSAVRPSKGKPFSHVASRSKPNIIAGHEMPQLENKIIARKREITLPGLRESRVLHCSFFLGGGVWSNGRREETGDQGAHKNVQEAWLYIRALEILLARERREKERKGERESRWQLPITSRQDEKNDEWRCSCGRLQRCTCEWIYVCVLLSDWW